jgi:hypothetical protein
MYTLIYSRNRSDDQPVTFGDVTLDTKSVMIDILSLASNVRRVAGWVYPVRPAGNGTFERGKSQQLLFDKSRCIFEDFTPPYSLQFYPRYGVKRYILSVYSGEPSPDRPPHIVFPGTSTQVYRSAVTGEVFVAPDGESLFVAIAGTIGSLAAKAGSDGRLFLQFNYPSYAYSWGPPWILLPMNEQNWNEISANPGTITIPNNP